MITTLKTDIEKANSFCPIFLQKSPEPIKIGNREFQCPMCSKIFTQNCHCKRHMRTHTGKRPFSCSYCDYASNRKDNLRIHCLNNHSIRID